MGLEKIKLREYQKNIVENILKKGNTIVVLPTGTGKTMIAFYVLLKKGEGVFLAPTKPLVMQHYSNFVSLFPEKKEESAVITGETPKSRRKELYSKKFLFMTPQTLARDMERGVEVKRKVFVFDECHRAVGKYSYSFISERIKNSGSDSLIIGLTASPGGREEKIKEVMENLGISNVEIRTGNEKDIAEYIHAKKYRWVFASLSPSMREAISNLKTLIKEEREWFRRYGIKVPKTKAEIIRFKEKLSTIKGNLQYQAATHYSMLFNLVYMLEILETQGFHYLLGYVEKLKKRETRAMKKLFSNSLMKEVERIAKESSAKEYHPKFYKLLEVLEKNKNKKIIVFAQYVDTINLLFDFIGKNKYRVFKFIGKRKGFSRKKQQQILDEFRKSEEGVLISSSVGEEGIDIPTVDVVIFFDVVPSEIRAIQRKGRAGRAREGEIYFIITMNTVEVAFYRASVKREKIMKYKLSEMNKKRKEDKGNTGEKSRESQPSTSPSLLRNSEKQKRITEFF